MKKKILTLGMIAVLLLSVGCQSSKAVVKEQQEPVKQVETQVVTPAKDNETEVVSSVVELPDTAKEYLGDEVYSQLYEEEIPKLEETYQEALALYHKDGATEEDKQAAVKMVDDLLVEFGFVFDDGNSDSGTCSIDGNDNST